MRKKILIVIVILGMIVFGLLLFVFLRDQTVLKEPSQAQTNSTKKSADANVTQGGEMSESNQDRSITINIGSESYDATLADNDTARAFRDRLPLSLDMSDVNGNEKAFDLPNVLPSNPSNPGRIQNGDLMLYGSRTVVLFYESFSTSYTYTRIGQIDDTANLAETLGSGNAKVTFLP